MRFVGRGIGVVVVVVGLAATGCGGDDDSTAPSTTTTQPSEETAPASDLPEELADATGEIAYVYEVWLAWKDLPTPYNQEQDAGFVAEVRGAATVIDGLTPPDGHEQEHATVVADLEGLASAAPVGPDELRAVDERVEEAMRSLPCEVGRGWVGVLEGPDLEEYCDG